MHVYWKTLPFILKVTLGHISFNNIKTLKEYLSQLKQFSFHTNTNKNEYMSIRVTFKNQGSSLQQLETK